MFNSIEKNNLNLKAKIEGEKIRSIRDNLREKSVIVRKRSFEKIIVKPQSFEKIIVKLLEKTIEKNKEKRNIKAEAIVEEKRVLICIIRNDYHGEKINRNTL